MNETPERVRVWAYAKINLALEVLGRRDDGYHELRTIMHTVSLADGVELVAPVATDSLRLSGDGAEPLRLSADNSVSAALAAYRAASEGFPNGRGVAISVQKRIPTAAGLGGGSSDGAALLRALDALNARPLGVAALERIAASLGSDTPFFVRGGTQLAAGRGERLTVIGDWQPRWFVLLPLASADRKTARLFSLLRQSDYSDGKHTKALAESLRLRPWFDERDFINTFERVEAAAFPDNAAPRAALTAVCGHALLCGAGPSLFALAPDEQTAHAWEMRLRDRWPVFAVRGVGGKESRSIRCAPDGAASA